MTKLDNALLAAERLKELQPQINKVRNITKNFGKELEAKALTMGFSEAELKLMGFIK